MPASTSAGGRYTESNMRGYTPAKTEGIYHTGLTTQEITSWVQHEAVLANKKWAGTYWWHCHGKEENNLFSFAEADTAATAQQPNVHRNVRLLAHESVYWVIMTVDIEDTMKWCATCLDYQQAQSHKKTIPCDMLCKPCELVGTDIFSINYICCCVL